MSYEILSHSADEKFRATGETLDEAFAEAVKAFAEIVGADPEGGEYTHSVEVEAESNESLLFDFLDRMIFLQETEGVVINRAEKLEIEDIDTDRRLTADLKVDPIEASHSYQDIKAPTYNEMRVDYEDGKWIVEAVLDI